MKYLILVIYILSVKTFAWEHESGEFQISKLRFGGGEVFVALHPAPSGCNGGSQYRMHFKVNSTDSRSYQDMVSGLLAAYAAGYKLSDIWYSNTGTCSSSHILRLDMFEFNQK